MSQSTFLTLPRELRDETFSYLTLPEFVYTSSSKPNTENLHRGKVSASTYVDTRIYLPCRIPPNVLSICRQLRDECLQHHTYTLNTHFTFSSPPTRKHPTTTSTANILAKRLGTDGDETAERLSDHCTRITLEAQRSIRGAHGYYIPERITLSPRFLALLPLLKNAKNLRLVVWPGYDWWNGSRPRATKLENGRQRIDPDGVPETPDAVSHAIGKVLETLSRVEEVQIDILAHVGDLSRWDLPDAKWENVQYWLDGPVARQGIRGLKKVTRRLLAVWDSQLTEGFYEQEEIKLENGMWSVKRKGDMRTPSVLALADEGELDGENVLVDEEFEISY